MILETATVISIEEDAVWVEALQKSTCESCSAQKGCGTSVLSKLTGKTSRIRVLAAAEQSQSLNLGQDVTIAIPEDVIVKASLLVYLVPLITSLTGLWLFSASSDIVSVGGAFIGLLVGGAIVSRFSAKTRDNPRLNPVLYDFASDQQAVNLI